ncbi:hypothetical protein RB599_010079 [Gaeumannomyces hyphopodioides]
MNCKAVYGNTGRSLAATDGLLEYAREKRADVVCVTEPALINNKPRRHPGWVCAAKNGPKCKAAIYVGKHLANWSVEIRPRYHSVSVCLTGLAISVSYWHPRQGKDLKARAWCAALDPGKRRLLVGDFNAKHPDWNNNPRWSQKGQELVDLTTGLGLHLLNHTKEPTHRKGNTLDLAFGPPEASARLGYWVSDHKALTVTVKAPTQAKIVPSPYLPWEEQKKAKTEINKELGEPPETATTTAQLDAQAWHIHDVVNGVVRVLGARRATQPRARWWTPELKKAREQGPHAFRALCRKTRRNHYQSQLATAGPNELGPLFKWKNPSPDDRPSELRVAGRRITDQAGIAAALADSAFPKPTTATPKVRWWDTKKVPETLAEKACSAPNRGEVKQAFLIKTSTSPGPDGITVRNLRGLWDKRLEGHLTAICQGAIRLGHFPQAWKQATVVTLSKPGRDHKTTSGWRPITLLSVFGKGLERLMQRRMTVAAVLGNAVSRDTAGALPCRSAQDLVASLVFDADKARLEGKHGFLATFDVKSAFPSVSKATLGTALAAQGWRPETVALATSFVSDRKYQFKWHNEGFRASDGLPQGSPWSPVLLTLVLATVVRAPITYAFGSTFTYMDDIAQYNVDRDPEKAARRATRMAWLLAEDLQKAGLKIDPGKTDLLYTPPGGPGSKGKAIPPLARSLYLPTGRKEASNQITWLGVTLKSTATEGISFPANVATRVAKARALTGLTIRTNIVSRGLRPDAARTWFKSGVVPTLSYGLWPLFQGFQNKKAVAELKTLERATKPPLKALTPAWRTSPAALRHRVMGFSPQEVWGRELARASERMHTLPENHPVSYRLRHTMETPSRLSRLCTLTPWTNAPRHDPVGPEAEATADLFGVNHRPAKRSHPKGDPGPRLSQADPEPWWEANRPASFSHVSWDPKYTWEKDLHGMGPCEKITHDPALVEGRNQLHTLLAEGSGHGNFESYHLRFNHTPAPNWYCICGQVKEVGHTDTCELRRIPAPWRKEPRLAQNNTEEAKWWRRGRNAMIRIRIEKVLKNMGIDQLMHISKNGVEGKGQAPRVRGPEDSDTEEELPLAEVGRLE